MKVVTAVLASFAASFAIGCVHPPPAVTSDDRHAAEDAVYQVLDDFHHDAAVADETRYFALLAPDATFLGTDATEHWSKDAFRAFAHPYFAKGKAWSFTPTTRHVTVAVDDRYAWFDETLATPNLGPCRGSGVLRREEDGTWKIVQYNLALTIPNERVDDVRALLVGRSATR